MQWVGRAALHLTHAGELHLRTRTVTCLEATLLLAAFASMLVAIATARAWISRCTTHPALPWLALLVVWQANYHFLLVPEIRTQAPYDLPSMALFGLGVYAAWNLARPGQRLLFYAALLLGTLNRESTLFLPLAFWLLNTSNHASPAVSTPEGPVFSTPKDPVLSTAEESFPVGSVERTAVAKLHQSPAQPAAIHAEAALQLVLWFALVRLCDHLSGGPGTLELHLPQNARLLANPAHWPTFLSVFGFLWLPLALGWRRIADPSLRRLVWLAPPWLLVMLLYADPLEIRVHSEWIVPVAVATAAVLEGSGLWKSLSSPLRT